MGNRKTQASNLQPAAFFLVGTTASGKSAVAQHIAECEGQLIVSADSMNLYRGMDIGTAKPSCDERRRVDYAGINLSEPTGKFSVANYLSAVKSAFASGRETIVVGGTGLYIKCLTEGFDDVPPENRELRSELETLDFKALEKRAQADASERYGQLSTDDRQNPRRLIRILEKVRGGSAASTTGRRGLRPSSSWGTSPRSTLVGLRVEREMLHKRIEQRVEQMYAAGLLDEARGLIELDLSQTALQAIGYAEAFAVLKNDMTLEEAKEQTVIRTRQLAKRQMTWFRNQLNVEWIDVPDGTPVEEVAEDVLVLWKRLGKTPIVF